MAVRVSEITRNKLTEINPHKMEEHFLESNSTKSSKEVSATPFSHIHPGQLSASEEFPSKLMHYLLG